LETNSSTVRLFVAINFPDELKAALHAALESLRRAAPEVRWADQDRMHLTIKFLGEQPPSAVDPLLGALREVASRYGPISLELRGLNAFPNLRRPRVVWLGMTADPKLELLQHDVETACAGLGHPIEGRAFRPHVTLGRVKDASVDAGRLAAAARGVDFEGYATAEAIDLMVSEHTGGAPVYRVVGSVPLSRH
jgi:2'-5' RNA ligase